MEPYRLLGNGCQKSKDSTMVQKAPHPKPNMNIKKAPAVEILRSSSICSKAKACSNDIWAAR